MKFTVEYSEQCYGYITFEADNQEQADEMLRKYREGSVVDGLTDDKHEMDYNLEVSHVAKVQTSE